LHLVFDFIIRSNSILKTLYGKKEIGNYMQPSKFGAGVIIGANPKIGNDVVIWNYVVIGDNVEIGDGTKIGSFVDIGKGVKIGKNCIIQAHVTISNECVVKDDVFIGPNTTILNDRYPNSIKLRPVTVNNKAIIGGGVIILADVNVGENSFVAGASVVTKDVPENTAVKGLPARPYEEKVDYDIKKRRYETGPSKARHVAFP
jgi:acetyltransferase-like isoleucine patch superfamily enzyme